MKHFSILILLIVCLSCAKKGPKTFNSAIVGKTKSELIAIKGVAREIKVFDNAEAYVYKTREEYFGNVKTNKQENSTLPTPKKIYVTEHIYYINEKGIVYKYQIWKKRID